MKRLLLARHANSPWKDANIPDHDRGLDDRGLKEASTMSKKLIDREAYFDSMLTSSALRAVTTCQVIASDLGFNMDNIEINKNMYGANCEELKQIIVQTDNRLGSLALFGHNPTFHTLSEFLYREAILKFPTCAMLYVIFFTKSWQNCFDSDRKVLFFDYPKNI